MNFSTIVKDKLIKIRYHLDKRSIFIMMYVILINIFLWFRQLIVFDKNFNCKFFKKQMFKKNFQPQNVLFIKKINFYLFLRVPGKGLRFLKSFIGFLSNDTAEAYTETRIIRPMGFRLHLKNRSLKNSKFCVEK